MIQRLLTRSQTLLQIPRYNYLDQWQQHFIRPYKPSMKTPQQFKNIYKKQKQLRPFPMMRANFYDVLHMPGLDKDRLMQIQKQVIMKGEVSISNQFIATLMYHLAKNKLMLGRMMEILEDWVPRHKGEYSSRQVFGCLYGSIIYHRKKYINFFLDQNKASGQTFQLSQTVEIIQALNKNTQMTLQQKHKFWQQNFKQVFLDNIHRVKGGYVTIVFRIFEAFKQFQYYDEQIWDHIFILMDNKGGWVRTTILEKIYPLTGTFDKAKLLFDKYYTQISTNKNIQWRYNMEQLRLFTSQQMIAKSQQNINLNPSFRSFVPPEKLQKLTEKYEKWLIYGSVKEDEQIIKDKSQSFGYAIKDRFESLTKDNVDFSKLTKKEFEQLFGEYDEAMMKDKPEGQGEEQNAEQQ